MSSTITALTSGGGLAMAGDTSGQLELKTNNGTTAVTIDASQNVGIGSSTINNNKFLVKGTHAGGRSIAAVQTDQSATGSSVYLGFYNSSDSRIGIVGCDTATNMQMYAVENVPMLFGTNNTERMRIDSSGNLLVDTTDPSINGKGVAINSQSYLGDAYGRINIKKTFSGNVVGVNFSYNNGTVGNITYSNTAVAYNTSSDYRLKENIAPMTGALARVSALKPVTYKWKADGSSGQGFIAHELQAVVPECVTGEKDAVETVDDVDAEGKVIGTKEVPKYQGIDTSFLVATLTAAIQEQQAMITALQADVQALKGVA